MSEAMTLERTFVLQKTLLENRMELSNCQVYRIMKKQILITKTKDTLHCILVIMFLASKGALYTSIIIHLYEDL